MTERLSRCITCLLSTILLVGLALPVHAHNGSVVVTSVVDGVEVDGDLSDWPGDIPWHPVGLNLYGNPESHDGDISARFRIAVDVADLKVYAAVEVRDDSPMPEPMGYRTWNSHDSVSVLLEVPSPNQNNGKEPNEVNLDSAEVMHVIKSQSSFFECSFDLRDAGYTDFSQPLSAAFTVACNDKDEDGSFTVKFWSPEIDKSVDPFRRGDLVICGARRGRVKGKLARRPGLNDVGRLMLNFRSVDHPLVDVSLRTEPGGTYKLDLPEGRYLRSGTHLPPVTLEVRDGETTVDSIEYALPALRRLPLAEYDSREKLNSNFAPMLNRGTNSQHYEINNLHGLPNSGILALAEDSTGALWIGTEANLARYDGTRLSVFTDELAVRTQGLWGDHEHNRLWVVGKSGVGYISDGTMTKFPLLDEQFALCVGPTHDGRVAIGTKMGLFLWDNEQFKYQGTSDGLPDEYIAAIVSDQDRGVTWIGTNMGLVAFDGTNYELYDQHGLDDPRIVSLFVDSKGRLWTGTASSLYYFEGDRFHLVHKHETERKAYARSFAELNDGTIRVGAFDEVVEIPPGFPQTGHVIHPEAAPCESMLLDRNRQLWMGFGHGELWRDDRGLQKKYTASSGSFLRFPCSVGDHLWMLHLTPGFNVRPRKWAAVRFDKTTSDWQSFPITLPADAKTEHPFIITNFFASDNGVWCGTKAHGVFKLRDKQWEAVKLDTKSFTEISFVTEDSQQRLWIGTLDQLFRSEDGKMTPLTLPHMPGGTELRHLAESPDGRFAIGTTEGIFVVDDKMQLLIRHHESTGLLANDSKAIRYGADGKLWVASNSGLQSIRGGLRSYRAKDGMLDDRPGWLLQIWDDEVWCGAHAGINRISLSNDVIQHLLSNDGFGEHQITGAARDGETMWLTGGSGVWCYSRSTESPRVSITGVVTTESMGPRDRLFVTSDLKSVQVKLQATSSKTRSGGMIYQHQIDDGAWKRTEPNAKFDVPPKGEYQLRFRAIDRDLRVSETLQIALNVRPPYGRWLKNLLLVAAVIASVVLGLLYFVRIRSERSDLEQSVKDQSVQLSDLERQLQHSEKMKALGTLATGVAHDFNNSLLAINGNAELALMSESAADKDELISELLAVTTQAADLTRSMLMFGGKGTAKKQTVDLNVPISEAEKILRRTLPASIAFACTLSDEPIYCEADPSQIQQVVVNLALNARDAMPKGGLLKLQLEEAAGNARILVSDIGCGMSEETQERIFEPFYTEKTRGKGTGLGLAMVHAIVGDHGGEVIVNSGEGKGSEFQVVLPLSDPGPDPQTADLPVRASRANNNGRVLLADDETHVRTTLAKGLRQAGFEVETVGDGQEFVSRANLRQFDLVIVDVDMPGENGWDGLRKVRETHADRLAIVISGLPSGEHRIDERTTAFLRKPFSLRKLTDTAARLLTDSA